MTKEIIHAIKKFLRVGVVAVTVTSGLINASAQRDIPKLCLISCNNQLNVSLDGSGYALIDPTMIWEEAYNESCVSKLDQIVVEIKGSSPVYLGETNYENTVATTSALLDCSLVSQNVEYSLVKYYSDGTKNSCLGNILLEDTMKPNITCSDLIINCTENINPYQLSNTYNNSIPSATDNCGIPTLTFQDSEENYDCYNPELLKKITRVWTATDGSGNQERSTQNIFVKKGNGADIQFPAHIENSSSSNLSPEKTGYPTLYGVKIKDHDSYKFSSHFKDRTMYTYGGGFKIFRNWTVIDWCTNEIFTYTQIVKDKNLSTSTIANSTSIEGQF